VPAIDVHVHPNIPGIVEHYAPSFWGRPRQAFGMETHVFTLDELLSDMDEADVEYSALLAFDCSCSAGWKISNEDVAALVAKHPDRLIGLASVDPHKGHLGAEELEFAVRELGLRGLKLHPPTQHFYADDPFYYPIWAKAEELGVPILCHVGHTFVGGSYLKYAEPKYLDAVAADFPNLTIMCAHFGFPWVEQVISLAWTHPNVVIELSGWSPRYIPDVVWRYASKFADRMVFGTDYPGLKPARFIKDLEEIDINDEVKRKILYDNARRILFGG
jgi:predicted TIM-barrel fold metal-dependent hydrolase